MRLSTQLSLLFCADKLYAAVRLSLYYSLWCVEEGFFNRLFILIAGISQFAEDFKGEEWNNSTLNKSQFISQQKDLIVRFLFYKGIALSHQDTLNLFMATPFIRTALTLFRFHVLQKELESNSKSKNKQNFLVLAIQEGVDCILDFLLVLFNINFLIARNRDESSFWIVSYALFYFILESYRSALQTREDPGINNYLIREGGFLFILWCQQCATEENVLVIFVVSVLRYLVALKSTKVVVAGGLDQLNKDSIVNFCVRQLKENPANKILDLSIRFTDVENFTELNTQTQKRFVEFLCLLGKAQAQQQNVTIDFPVKNKKKFSREIWCSTESPVRFNVNKEVIIEYLGRAKHLIMVSNLVWMNGINRLNSEEVARIQMMRFLKFAGEKQWPFPNQYLLLQVDKNYLYCLAFNKHFKNQMLFSPSQILYDLFDDA